MRKLSFLKKKKKSRNYQEIDWLISKWNPWQLLNSFRNLKSTIFLQGHKEMLEGYWSVFPLEKSIGIDKFMGPGLTLLISLYSQGDRQPFFTHDPVFRDLEIPTWLNGYCSCHPDVWNLEDNHTEFPLFWSHLCSQLPHSIISVNLLSLQTSYQQKKTQPSGHEIKTYLLLVNYYRTTYP